MEWLRTVAANPEPGASTEGMHRLAFCLDQGHGVEKKDPKAAFELWEQAAERGHGPSKVQLGQKYFTGGDGACEQDTAKALELWEGAAETGEKEALYILGLCYTGVGAGDAGVEKDVEKAKGYFGQAAALGDERAQLQLSLLAAEEQQAGQTQAEGEAAAAAASGDAPSGAGEADAKALEEAAAQEGAVKTESGLVIRSVVAGTGATPTAADTVTVHYQGSLADGTVFDSSIARGEPLSFPLGGVIAGWTEGLQLMKEVCPAPFLLPRRRQMQTTRACCAQGESAELTIPSHLGYGPNGTGPIPGGATLIFRVELIKVEGGAKE